MSVAVTLEHASEVERKLTISVPGHDIDAKVDQKAQSVAKTAHIKGFRPGKVPIKEIKRRYGASLRQEVVSEAIDEAYQQALASESLSPVGYPQIDLKQNTAGEDLEFVALVEIFPEVVIDQFDGVTVEQCTAEITEDDINGMIEKIQRQKAEWQTVEEAEAAVESDRLTIDFEGKIDGETFEGGQAEAAKVTIGEKAFIPGFEEQLVGMTQGHQGDITVTFPEDYSAEELQGKEAVFSIEVKSIERQTLPEVDEAFINEFGVESGEMADFRDEVKQNMHREMVQQAKNKAREDLLEQLVENHPFVVPKGLISHQIDHEKQQFNQSVGGQLSADVLNQVFNLQNEELTKKAETTVRRAIIVDQFTEDASNVTDEERQEKAKLLAVTHDDPESVAAMYIESPDLRKKLDQLILEDKAFEELFAKVAIEVKSVSYDELMTTA